MNTAKYMFLNIVEGSKWIGDILMQQDAEI
jgi:hypothetical protein